VQGGNCRLGHLSLCCEAGNGGGDVFLNQMQLFVKGDVPARAYGWWVHASVGARQQFFRGSRETSGSTAAQQTLPVKIASLKAFPRSEHVMWKRAGATE